MTHDFQGVHGAGITFSPLGRGRYDLPDTFSGFHTQVQDGCFGSAYGTTGPPANLPVKIGDSHYEFGNGVAWLSMTHHDYHACVAPLPGTPDTWMFRVGSDGDGDGVITLQGNPGTSEPDYLSDTVIGFGTTCYDRAGDTGCWTRTGGIRGNGSIPAGDGPLENNVATPDPSKPQRGWWVFVLGGVSDVFHVSSPNGGHIFSGGSGSGNHICEDPYLPASDEDDREQFIVMMKNETASDAPVTVIGSLNCGKNWAGRRNVTAPLGAPLIATCQRLETRECAYLEILVTGVTANEHVAGEATCNDLSGPRAAAHAAFPAFGQDIEPLPGGSSFVCKGDFGHSSLSSSTQLPHSATSARGVVSCRALWR